MDNSLEIGPTVALYTDQTSNPAIPAVGAGVDITALRNSSGRAPKYQLLEMALGSTGTTVTLPAPVKVYVERGSKVRYAATLNNGAAITLANPATGAGHSELLQGLALNDRLVIVAGGALTGGGGFAAQITGVRGAP